MANRKLDANRRSLKDTERLLKSIEQCSTQASPVIEQCEGEKKENDDASERSRGFS